MLDGAVLCFMELWNLRPGSITNARLEFGVQSVIMAKKKAHWILPCRLYGILN